ncbi:dickkopf-related protein 3-like isoform X2 [Thalassophryne amazonica]|uniref:dickkopf-related protein 3-like isoform X2 n=1 Tax=Thalassophryne amazonica TaxID=390379 RepID=UPI0014712BFB|nr:dickkopf-related protein 3-like isoform X2 [Thalassophryne amazonica]
MSGTRQLSVASVLCLSVSWLWAAGATAGTRSVILHSALERVPVTLNDMLREVEELMEDTQHILEEAVDQISTESAKSSLTSLDLNYHNKTGKDGRSLQVFDKTDKENNNETGETHISHVHVEISQHRNNVDHECMVDEDCGESRYCLYEIKNSKCLPCIPTDMPCTKDEECCSDQMCVWGQCTVNATEGIEGAICQLQTDCGPDLCCAFLRELLFPVCQLKPKKGESCLSHPNLLMDMLAWDQEGPRDHCPCVSDLQCQPHGRGSVCGE